MNISKILFLSILIFFLVSCSNNANTSKEFIIETDLFAGGPLFEGSNTCQADLSTELNTFLNKNKISKDDLVDVKLKLCEITKGNLNDFAIIESISLQLMSDNYPMQSVAVINPIPDGAIKVRLDIADEQEEILPILSDKNLYIIADVILKEDLNDDIKLKSKLIFSINYYKE